MSKITQIWILISFLGRRIFHQPANILLCACIIFCTAVAASLSLFGKSVQSALVDDIGNFLGAPLVVRSAKAILTDPINIKELDNPVRTQTLTASAISNDFYQSVSLKGVSDEYPLQGELLIKFEEKEGSSKGERLAGNVAWVDRRVLNELNINLGDNIQIGKALLTIKGEVVFEPDRLTQAQHTLPRVFVSLETLKNTGTLLNNENVDHRVLFSGSDDALSKLENLLPSLAKSKYELLKPTIGNHPFSRISLRAERMSDLVLILVLLMCGAAATMLAEYSVKRYAASTAVLRCMGLSQNVIVIALSLQLFFLAIFASFIGFILAWLVHPSLLLFMKPYMDLTIAIFDIRDLVLPLCVGIVMVLTFALPSLYRLTSTSIVSVLRGNLIEKKRYFFNIACATALIIMMLWYSSDNAQLTTILVVAIFLIILLSVIFGWFMSKLSAQCHHFFSGPLKIAIRSIGRSPKRHITPLVSISITMMAVLMTVTLRGSFIDSLQIHRLEADGNYIFTGLPHSQKEAFEQLLQNNQIELKRFYPTLSAKLVSINSKSLEMALNKESETRGQLRSKVRLSWAEKLPDNNILLDGEWPTNNIGGVSVENEVMTDLGLRLGDELSFYVGNDIVTSVITSVRKYKNAESSMMFWFMFSPETLEVFDHHYMGGFLLNDDSIKNKTASSLGEISKYFPQVRIIELEQQISKIRNIFFALTRLMNVVLVLLLIASMLLITTSSFVGNSQQRKQLTLLRTFGLHKRQVYGMNVVQQFTIGLVACLVGFVGTQAVAGTMFHEFFNLNYEQDWSLVASLVLFVSAGAVLLSCLFTFRYLRLPSRSCL